MDRKSVQAPCQSSAWHAPCIFPECFDGFATPCVDGTSCPTLIQAVDDNDLSTWHLALVPRVSLGNVWLFGKVGYYRGEIDTQIDLPDNDFNQNGVLLGGGARWHFSEPWSVSLEATRYDDNIYQFAIGFGWGLRPPGSPGG